MGLSCGPLIRAGPAGHTPQFQVVFRRQHSFPGCPRRGCSVACFRLGTAETRPCSGAPLLWLILFALRVTPSAPGWLPTSLPPRAGRRCFSVLRGEPRTEVSSPCHQGGEPRQACRGLCSTHRPLPSSANRLALKLVTLCGDPEVAAVVPACGTRESRFFPVPQGEVLAAFGWERVG